MTLKWLGSCILKALMISINIFLSLQKCFEGAQINLIFASRAQLRQHKAVYHCDIISKEVPAILRLFLNNLFYVQKTTCNIVFDPFMWVVNAEIIFQLPYRSQVVEGLDT
jgi:hypothetical protein